MEWDIVAKCKKCGSISHLENQTFSNETEESALEAIYCTVGGCDHLQAGSYGKQEKTLELTSMKPSETES